MLNRGIFRMEEYVEGGWLSGLRYEDEVLKDLEKRTDSKPDELKTVRMAWHLQRRCTAERRLDHLATGLCSLKSLASLACAWR